MMDGATSSQVTCESPRIGQSEPPDERPVLVSPSQCGPSQIHSPGGHQRAAGVGPAFCLGLHPDRCILHGTDRAAKLRWRSVRPGTRSPDQPGLRGQGFPASNNPGAFPSLRIVGHTREQPVQLDCGQ